MTNQQVGLVLGATMFVLTGCGGSPAAPAAAFLEDDFSAPACLFGSLEGTSSFGYSCADGEFRAWIDNDQAPYDFVSAAGGESYGDVRLEVDARIDSAVPYGGAIVVCRGNQTAGDFYEFVLSPDGTVTVSDYLDGEEQVARFNELPEGTLLPDWNHLRVDCSRNHLAFYVNDVLALERDLDALARGEIGLGAGGASEGRTAVRFDNLVVTSP